MNFHYNKHGLKNFQYSTKKLLTENCILIALLGGTT